MVDDNIFTLPHYKYVRRLSSAITPELELSTATIAYLKARMAKLAEKDKNVNIILDEVFALQLIQYQCGKMYGTRFFL